MSADDFEPNELQFIARAMQGLEKRCGDLADQIGGAGHLSPSARGEISAAYAELKTDLKTAAKFGTVDGTRRSQSRGEQCFFGPAVKRAAIALRPATNSHPIHSRWTHSLLEARREFSYYLAQLEASQ